MSALDQGRILTAEVKWAGDAGAITWIGTAPIHQFWPRLAPQFGAVFLAPQRRMDGEVVAWSWRESDRDEEIAAAELLALRASLGTSLESFRKAQPPRLEGSDAAPAKGRTNLDLLWDAVGALVADLLAKSDQELLAFVVRTEAGLRIHSWGARKAAAALAPEQLGHEVSGIVIAAGKAAADVEVLLKNSEGEIQAKTLSDGTGRFRFPNVGPGSYRLFAQQGSTLLPTDGLPVLVENEATSGLKLRLSDSVSEPESDESAAEAPPAQRRRKPLPFVLAGIAALVAVLIWWRSAVSSSPEAAAADTADGAVSAQQAEADLVPPRRSSTIDTSVLGTATTSAASGRPVVRDQSIPIGSDNAAASNVPAIGPTSGRVEDNPPHLERGSASQGPPAPSDGTTASGSPPQAAAGPHSSATSFSASTSSSAPVAPSLSTSKGPQSGGRPDSSTPASASRSAAERDVVPESSSDEAAAASLLLTKIAWAHRNQLAAEDWKIRLLVDPILPTDPTANPSPEAIDVLRRQVMDAQLAAMPGTFRHLQASRGYTVQLPTSDPRANYRWQLPAGDNSAVKTSLDLSRAELWWPGSEPAPGIYELTAAAGQPRFRLEVSPANAETVMRAAGVGASYWLQVEEDSADLRGGSNAPGGRVPPRFTWQRASGGAVPIGWISRNGNRVEIPLSDSVGTEISSDLAWFDSVTGWAATAQFTFRSVSAVDSLSPAP